MNRYIIINEPHVEISRTVKCEDIINAHIANGMQNGTVNNLGVFDTFDEAKSELKKYKCSYAITSGFANVKFYEANFTYIAKQEWNDSAEEWEDTGDYEFADLS